ncbi:hypothetical protein ACWD0Z_20960 [Streptomyces sp. NPDC003007]
MLQRIAPAEPGGEPAGIGPALAVASVLHPATGRTTEVAPTAATATRRTSRSAKDRRRASRG